MPTFCQPLVVWKKAHVDIRILQIDSFSRLPFRGNPAGVCLLPEPMPASWMQQVAHEMNLSETAFLLPEEGGYSLRWFTPTVEVDLCGHATLASAHALWTEGDLDRSTDAHFSTRSGVLTAHYQDSDHGDHWIELNFPASLSEPTSLDEKVKQALGEIEPLAIAHTQSKFLLIEIADEAQVRSLEPNFSVLKTAPYHGVIVTSRSNTDAAGESGQPYDFVSRFFAPAIGIDEDPVTGAAHCVLAPFWRDRLGKDEMLAYQASRRGGEMQLRYDGGDRVTLAGQAVTVFRGTLQA